MSRAPRPQFFIVSSEPELLEVEPNDDFKSPQKIDKLPVTVNGQPGQGGRRRCFAVALKKGETVTAGVGQRMCWRPHLGRHAAFIMVE